MATERIYHFVDEGEYEACCSNGSYMPSAFASDGFIHCSPAHLAAAVATLSLPGRGGLVLLEIDTEFVGPEITWENLEGGANLFPHIYGPLNLDAVVAVHPFEPEEDGRFELPSGIASDGSAGPVTPAATP